MALLGTSTIFLRGNLQKGTKVVVVQWAGVYSDVGPPVTGG